jgi:hypothetical protein
MCILQPLQPLVLRLLHSYEHVDLTSSPYSCSQLVLLRSQRIFALCFRLIIGSSMWMWIFWSLLRCHCVVFWDEARWVPKLLG